MKLLIFTLFVILTSAATAEPLVKRKTQYADLNGDGKTDIIHQSDCDIADARQGINNCFYGSLSTGTKFSEPKVWIKHGGNYMPGRVQYADLNGDKKADLIYQGDCGAEDSRSGINNCFYVSISNGLRFLDSKIWIKHGGGFVIGQAQYADVNGDKKLDLLFQGNDNIFWVSLSTGAGFSNAKRWAKHDGEFVLGQAQYADVNGDKIADLILQKNDNSFWVSLSDGNLFLDSKQWMKHGGSFIRGQAQYANVTNDKKADLIFQGGCPLQDATVGLTNCFYVSVSDGVKFSDPKVWIKHGGNFVEGQSQYADVSGDGLADLILQGGCAAEDAKVGINNCFYISISNGSRFSSAQLSTKHGGSYNPSQSQYADFSGDGKFDLAFQGLDNSVWLSASAGTAFAGPQRWLDYIGPPPPLTNGEAASCYIPGTQILIGTPITSGLRSGRCRLHYAAVVVIPPSSGTGNGTVLLPDGSLLNVSGSATAGLQEALNYAANWGWDLFVYGAGKYSSSGNYNLHAPLVFPPLQGKTAHFLNVNLDFGPSVTNAAFIFESSMMVEVELTGRIYAPFANSAVRFSPRSPVPLDGLILGIHGIVDSRFQFQETVAKNYGFYFDPSGAASVTNSSFGIGQTSNTWGFNVGSCARCIFENSAEVTKSRRNDTTLTLDILHPTGVAVLPPQGSLGQIGTVILPDGKELNVSASVTSGVREAIEYAFPRGLDVVIYGRGLQQSQISTAGGRVTYPTNGFYQINSTINIPSSKGRTLRIYNATLNAGLINGPILQVNPSEGLEFELTGQIVAPPTSQSTTVRLISQGGPIKNNLFKLGSLVGGNIALSIESADHPISDNILMLRELISGKYGLMIRSQQDQPIQSNIIRAAHLHGFFIGGADFQAPNSATTVLNNRFDLLITSDGINSQFGAGIGGRGNTIFVDSDKYVFSTPGSGPNTILRPPTARPPAF